MRANVDAHLRAIGGAAGDVEAAARRAGAAAEAQLAALEPLTRKPVS
jgi:hypothetical protein